MMSQTGNNIAIQILDPGFPLVVNKCFVSVVYRSQDVCVFLVQIDCYGAAKLKMTSRFDSLTLIVFRLAAHIFRLSLSVRI
jgi:hypothetical protein